MNYIPRKAAEIVRSRLTHFDSVALIGPRQAGKTTLARQIADRWESGSKYLDLENPSDRRLLDDPVAYLSSYPDRLIVLDEIHRTPEIFQVLRGQIDERRRLGRTGGKFLILGSASMDLLRQSSESLTGRISYVEMRPLTPWEICNQDITAKDQTAKVLDPRSHHARSMTRHTLRQHEFTKKLDRLWLQGGFPLSYLFTVTESLQWRIDFIQTYLERDLPQFGLQVATDPMDRLWRMIGNDQGELYNAQRYARSLDVSGKTVDRYLDILKQMLMIRLLQPWHTNTGKRLVKSPRPYIRDSGILHALLNLHTMDNLRSHSVAGKSWEGFVIESLISATNDRARPYFYRTSAGAEIDLVLEFAPGNCWAIEIKMSSAPTFTRGFHSAANDIGAERQLLIHKGLDAFPMRHGVEAMPLLEAMNEVSSTTSI